VTTVVEDRTAERSDVAVRSAGNAGLPSLLRLIARRDRVRVSLWLVGIVGLVVATVASITGLYDTQADLDRYAALVRDNAALIVQAGPGYGLQDPATPATLGAVVMNEMGIWVIIAVGLMSLFMVVRHTRTEEETGRAETVRALPVGRHAQLTAAIIATAIANVIVATGSVAVLVAYDLPVTGSVAFGLALVGAGVVFAAVGAVTAQVAGAPRAALGLGGLVLGVSYVLRAIGDIGAGMLSWLSPIGWAQGIRAFADERWWVLVLPVVATAVLLLVAYGLQARRDLGAGLLPEQPGPAVAPPRLSTPLGLAVRLQRASVVSWAAGLVLFGFLYGVIADQAESILEDNPEMEDFLTQSGQGSITDAFLSTAMLILALIGAGFTVASTLRTRSEEAAGRAEAVLAAPVSRARWAGSHVAVAAAGTVGILALAGAAVGVGYAAIVGEWEWVARMLGAGLVTVPATWILGGVALVAYGISPKLALASWGYYAFVLVVGMLGALLDLPQWVLNLSPFEHVPAIPSESMDWAPVSLLVAVAAALVVAGFVALRHRDMS
jgi:ABC-2 type transport system permease protein